MFAGRHQGIDEAPPARSEEQRAPRPIRRQRSRPHRSARRRNPVRKRGMARQATPRLSRFGHVATSGNRHRLGATRLRFGILPNTARSLDAGLLGGLALLAFIIHSVAWPLWPGRDAQTYLMYYLDMRHPEPVFPQLMLFRTPAAPLLFGLPLEIGGSLLAEAVMGVCYVASLHAFYCAGAFWGRRIGLGLAIALVLYPAYGALFHNVSSDGPFAFGVALWAPLVCATAVSPRTWKFVLHGVVLFLLVMIRPSALLFLPFIGAFPLLLGLPVRARVRAAVLTVVSAGGLLVGWAGYNQMRYDDFAISRMSPAHYPLFRLLTMDRLIDPGNGPASRDLAQAIESDLLTEEPYRSYGIDLQEFLHTGRIRMWSDLAGLVDRTWGWESDYRILRLVAIEAILRHPGEYAVGVVNTTRELLLAPYYPPAATAPPPRRTIICELGCVEPGFMTVDGQRVPIPTQNEPIPTGNAYWLASTPDNSISTDWSSLAQPRLVFEDPADQRRFDRLSAELWEMMALLPSRDGSGRLVHALNFVTQTYPSMWIWIVIGAVGLWFRRPRHLRILGFLCGLAVVNIVGTALGEPAAPEYRLPLDPLFILFGVIGLIGGQTPPIRREHRATGTIATRGGTHIHIAGRDKSPPVRANGRRRVSASRP